MPGIKDGPRNLKQMGAPRRAVKKYAKGPGRK